MLQDFLKKCNSRFRDLAVNESAFDGKELLQLAMLHDIAMSLRITSGRAELEAAERHEDYLNNKRKELRTVINNLDSKLKKETALKKKYYKKLRQDDK